jgi:hypothetical protein
MTRSIKPTPEQRWDDHNRNIAQTCLPIVEQYINGLITDYELLRHLEDVVRHRRIPSVGTLDRNTGLRYTPQMIFKYVGISGKVGFDGLE